VRATRPKTKTQEKDPSKIIENSDVFLRPEDRSILQEIRRMHPREGFNNPSQMVRT
jgi:hypothetical protein